MYPGEFTLGGGLTLIGGLAPADGWRRAGPASVLTGGNHNRVLTIVAGARVRLDGLEVAPAGPAWMGVVVDADGHAIITNCTLAGGTGPGGLPSAVSCTGEGHVEGCRLRGGPGEVTIAIWAFGGTVVVDCDVEASHIGVNCGGATIEGNRIRAGTYGVYIQGDDVRVRGNQITLTSTDPSARGVFVVNGDRLVIEDNTINGRADRAQLERWAHLPPRSWTYDESSSRDYSVVSITANGLWFHGEAGGPSGGPYTGPTQDLDDLLVHEPIQPLPAELLAEIRAFLRAHLPRA